MEWIMEKDGWGNIDVTLKVLRSPACNIDHFGQHDPIADFLPAII